MAEYVDCTPSWEAIVPMLVTIIRQGTFEGRWEAEKELKRMARLADRYVQSQTVEAMA